MDTNKPRLLTGDTPTGKLHLGHYVGSLEKRLQLQDSYACYFIIANVHAFTTRMHKVDEIHQNVFEITLDYLAAGIDPKKSTIFIQSEVPAIAELTIFLSMLLPYTRLMRNPTIKDEIRDKGLGDNYPFGFLLYAVGQMADILSFRPSIVPVGADQIPHVEMTREVARKFNQLYCGVDPHTDDADYMKKGGLFPIVEVKLSKTQRLVGTTGPDARGHLLKMSKSLNNAIYLSDDTDTIARKVMSMYTDPKRLKACDPGTVENNPLWIFHEIFNPDHAWVKEAEARYRAGSIGDVACKKRLIEVLEHFIAPMRERRKMFASDLIQVSNILKDGTLRANAMADETLRLAKLAMRQRFYE